LDLTFALRDRGLLGSERQIRSTSEIEAVLRDVYGSDTNLWMRRWRWFFLATAGLFGYADGSEWGVSHYRMKAVQIVALPARTLNSPAFMEPNPATRVCSPGKGRMETE
jgi:hypothetical protein